VLTGNQPPGVNCPLWPAGSWSLDCQRWWTQIWHGYMVMLMLCWRFQALY